MPNIISHGEMQTKTSVRPLILPLEGRPIPSVSKDVEPLDRSYSLAGMQNGTILWFLRKLNGHLPYDLPIPLLIIQENENMFTQRLVLIYSQQAYSLITPNWKQAK